MAYGRLSLPGLGATRLPPALRYNTRGTYNGTLRGISMWLHVRKSYPVGGNNAHALILYDVNPTYGTRVGAQLSYFSTPQVYAVYNTPPSSAHNITVTSTSFTVGMWEHWMFLANDADLTVYLIRNGSTIGTTPFTAGYDASANTRFTIDLPGGDDPTVSDYMMPAWVADVTVFTLSVGVKQALPALLAGESPMNVVPDSVGLFLGPGGQDDPRVWTPTGPWAASMGPAIGYPTDTPIYGAPLAGLPPRLIQRYREGMESFFSVGSAAATSLVLPRPGRSFNHMLLR